MVNFRKRLDTYWPLTTIVSGGQTGADQAGWRVAKALGHATHGWMPQGFLTETGCRPEFATTYGAEVDPEYATYAGRTVRNIASSTGTLLFGSLVTPGAMLALRTCRQKRRPRMCVDVEDVVRTGGLTVATVQAWIRTNRIVVLNVAGNRESTNPGIGVWVEAFLLEALRRP